MTMLEAEADCAAPFNVAILDMDTHGVDGAKLASIIKSRPDLCETLLMAMLSVDSPISPDKVKAMGFAGHITKPVRQAELFSSIMNVVASSKPETPPVAIDSLEATSEFFPERADSGSSPRILLAEDNEVNRVVTTEILRKAGYRYESVCNGAEAFEAVRSGRFDLVLMDGQMPVMDGFEATRSIRNWEQTRESGSSPPIPIVALTANALKGDRERCLQAGMNAYASKPVNPKQLLGTIATLLRSAAKDDFRNETSLSIGADDAASEPIDAIRLLDFCMDDAELALRVLSTFEQQALETIHGLAKSVGTGDAPDVARRSHALKGTAGSLAADRLSEAAACLERVAISGELSESENLLKMLTAEFDRCVAHLPVLRQRIAPGSQTVA